MEKLYIPQVQVRENALLIWQKPEFPSYHKRDTEGFKLAYSGQVKTGTEKRIRKTIDIFLQQTKTRVIFNPVIEVFHPFRLGFITLTVSSEKNVDGKFAYTNLLRPWLDYATKTAKVSNYIWKAELQERGQIHYHVTVDQFIRFDHIRDKWNTLQKKSGILNDFARRYGHFHPNSTDVHAVKNVRNFEAYLAKYIAKNTQNESKISGKIWDCSVGLKKARFSDELDTETENNIYRERDANRCKITKLENCTIVSSLAAKSLLSSSLSARYQQWI